MNGFGPSVAQPSAASLDPTKHVNYALGMVLGVDDLNQEFAYHSQRQQWTARDLLGYGTVWGLAVEAQDKGARGTEISVSSGVALNPRGQLIRVAPAQCANLNEWLAARTSDVVAHRVPTSAPNIFELPLHVVLSYRECLTDLVPIPGEPCRSEGDTVKPSRVADNFLIELSFDAPVQDEEDSLGEFVRWLESHIRVTSDGGAVLGIEAFLDAIRQAARAPEGPPTSPAAPAALLTETSPPTVLVIPASDVGAYSRALLRLWVTELRPLWRPNWLGERNACGGAQLSVSNQGNQLLLAQVTLRIQPVGLNEALWTVTNASEIVISEDRRPLLGHVRLLQELLLVQARGAVLPMVVAAGFINADPASVPTRLGLNGLRVRAHTPTATSNELLIAFEGYAEPSATGGPQYIVKALPAVSVSLPSVTLSFAGFEPTGFLLRASQNGAPIANIADLELMLEVTRYA